MLFYRCQPATYEDNWRTYEPTLVTETWTGNSIFEERIDIEESMGPCVPDEATVPNTLPVPIKQSHREIGEHNLIHLPYRDWCPICVQIPGQSRNIAG